MVHKIGFPTQRPCVPDLERKRIRYTWWSYVWSDFTCSSPALHRLLSIVLVCTCLSQHKARQIRHSIPTMSSKRLWFACSPCSLRANLFFGAFCSYSAINGQRTMDTTTNGPFLGGEIGGHVHMYGKEPHTRAHWRTPGKRPRACTTRFLNCPTCFCL